MHTYLYRDRIQICDIPSLTLRETISWSTAKPLKIACIGSCSGEELITISTICLEEKINDFYVHGYEVDLQSVRKARVLLHNPLAAKFENDQTEMGRHSYSLLKKALKEYPLENALKDKVKVYWKSIISEPLDRGYDLATVFNVMYYYPEEDIIKILKNVSAGLKTGGHLIIDNSLLVDEDGQFTQIDGHEEYCDALTTHVNNWFEFIPTEETPVFADLKPAALFKKR
ncbi:MAG: CheR family methyltransferase [Nanoarchaeota archaeon]